MFEETVIHVDYVPITRLVVITTHNELNTRSSEAALVDASRRSHIHTDRENAADGLPDKSRGPVRQDLKRNM